MLKVLYIVPAISYTSKGILKKQYDKVKAFESAGCDIKALLFSDSLDISFIEGNIYHYSVDLSEVKTKYGKTFIWRALPYLFSKKTNKIIYKETLRHLKNIDVVYIRYSLADINMIKLCKLIKSKGIKLVFEYNGYHYYDEKMNVKENPSVFTYYNFWNEKYLQGKFARYADTLVGVTHELTDYYAGFNPKAKKYTLSNGVDVSRFLKREPLTYDGKTVKFLFLSGSVNYWHGLDRFLNGLKQYTGETKIELTVAGFFHAEYKTYTYNNKNISVNFLASVDGEELNKLFNSHHIGIGSLALHRMNLKEASVLKVREYIVRGIPFILGYKDTDLMNAEQFKPYYFEVKPDESFVDIDAVIKFSHRVLSEENYSDKMSKLGGPLIDYKPKIEGLVKVMKEISAN